jgi:hypothetical protein
VASLDKLSGLYIYLTNIKLQVHRLEVCPSELGQRHGRRYSFKSCLLISLGGKHEHVIAIICHTSR